ncbi:Myb transcription factor [Cordyceps fumosorosea ARSEF 2679]|uniref:Myb transcription factor n=1 Tax=Cordyceps fumosorosea (strain ARSEF 2679) TaxID=1081104 RepID=A0A162MSE9_CORFA|nr:Myb transcription factor [Cordyceps fumosorosea ARSEF 2679]OAA66210.1 Myb transcription factor [Cordyceps fumosorosea ARSEF 2679]
MAETGTAATAVSPIEGHRRGPWSQAEDDKLIALVGEHGGLNWVRISISLGTRSPKQCRERFHQNLKPSLSHEPISANEGAFIIDCVHKIGKRWAEIARQMPGRSDNAVKNWWNGNQNRSKRSEARRRNSYLSAATSTF